MTTEKKQEEQKTPALFEVLLQQIGIIAKDQNMTLPEVLGHLDLCKKSAIDQVIAFQQQKAVSEPSEGDDKGKQEASSPEKA